MSTSKRIVQNFFALSIAEVASRVMTIALSIYITRILGFSALGQVTFAAAFTSYFSLFADFGLTTFGTREIARDQSRTNLVSNTILALQLGLAGGLLLILTGSLVFLPLSLPLKWLTFLYGLTIVPAALNMAYILQAHQQMAYVAISRIITQLLYVIVGLALLVFTNNVFVLPVSLTLAGIVGSIFIIYILRRQVNFKLQKPSVLEMRRFVMLTRAFLFGAVMIQIYTNLDSIMIQFMRGEREVGLYGAGYRVIGFAISFSAMLAAAYFPVLVQKATESPTAVREALSKILMNAGVLAFPLFIGGMLLSRDIFMLLYGSDNSRAILSLSLLFVIPLIGVLNMAQSNCLTALDNQKQATLSTVVGAVVNIVLNLVLIPMTGFIGAAVATIAAELGVCLYLLYNLSKYFSIGYIWSFARYALLVVPMVVWLVATQWAGYPLWIKFPMAVVLYGVPLFIFRSWIPEYYRKLITHVLKKGIFDGFNLSR